MSETSFPATARLKRSAEFQAVFARRASVSDEVLILYGCENALGRSRLGLSVSRKVGGAVVRNRWKRVFREAFRLLRPALPPGLDLVVIPRRGVAPPGLAQAQASLRGLIRRVQGRLRKTASRRSPEPPPGGGHGQAKASQPTEVGRPSAQNPPCDS